MSVAPENLDAARKSLAKLTTDEKRIILSELNETVLRERIAAARSEQPAPRKELSTEERIAIIEKIAALPVRSPNDGFSGADHDRILYGTSE
jgi:hypothetical protein